MRRTTVIIALAIIPMSLLTGCGKKKAVTTTSALPTTITRPSATTSSTTIVNDPKVRVKTLTGKTEKFKIAWSMDLAQVSGMSNSSLQSTVNASIRKDYTALITTADTADSVPVAESGNIQFPIVLSSTTKRVDKNEVALIVQETSDTGGAHPIGYPTALVYDLTTGKSVKLSDLFTGTSYLTTLSTQSAALLNASAGTDSSEVADATQPNADKFAVFAPLSGGLMVKFQQYEVGPFAIGEPEVTIPWSKLAANLSPLGHRLAGV